LSRLRDNKLSPKNGELVKTLTGWELVEEFLESALCVAFDDCHKIYLAMDEEELNYFTSNKWTTFTGSALEMLDQVWAWYEVESCSLRFVSAVKSGEFTTLIGQ